MSTPLVGDFDANQIVASAPTERGVCRGIDESAAIVRGIRWASPTGSEKVGA
ncbi:hypothetical protein [Isoptericola dokdonensis]|uniref:hypothetical protein n=1 Tax=Isoptericola dokdonensis TaxID=372663 RepID=UPI0012F8A4E8|nr:hypothetical protein [Isoptericola dokdonensis]